MIKQWRNSSGQHPAQILSAQDAGTFAQIIRGCSQKDYSEESGMIYCFSIL